MRIYLDACRLRRRFDDQSQPANELARAANRFVTRKYGIAAAMQFFARAAGGPTASTTGGK